LKLPCWKPTWNKFNSSFHGIEEIITFKHQSFFLRGVFYCELITLKLMKIRWSFLSFGFFAPYFQIKLSTHVSNFSSIFVIMSELKFFCWQVRGGLDSKLQHWRPSTNSWKKSKTLHLDCNGHLKDDIMHNHEQKKMKKSEKQDSMGKKTSFSAPCPSPLGQF
jgi:hypothetical protein